MKYYNAYDKLQDSISRSGSMLCVGLDSDISKLPVGFEKSINGLLEFNKSIIKATSQVAAAYKINFAFYEQYGSDGFDLLKNTFEIIPENIFTIADAKRGDIGNTSLAYARSVFDFFEADSVTINPYMGFDSIEPFLEYKNKFVFLLALTSNKGSYDFQRLDVAGRPLYQHIVEKTLKNYSNKNIGFVVGATHPDELAALRRVAEDSCFLIPGVGAQGADVDAVTTANNKKLALINVSRAIIYPETQNSYKTFEDLVQDAAVSYWEKMRL